MALRPFLKIAIAAVVALLVVGGSIVLAAGSSSPRTVHLACASKSEDGKLHYVGRSSDCPASEGTLVRFPQDYPVVACELTHSVPAGARAKLPPPAHKHDTAGMYFLVSSAGKCHAPKYPDSRAVTLPGLKDLKLCIGKRHGTFRHVPSYSECNDRELEGVLKKLNDRAPKATSQTVDVNEGTPKSITLSGTDPDGDHLTYSIASGPSHGTLSGTPPNLTYHPAANYAGPDSFKFNVNDGRGGSDTGTVSIVVHAASDAPKIDTSAGSTPYTENDPPTAIDPGLTVTDPDSANLKGATAAITGNFSSGDRLDFTNQNGITGNYSAATGVLTLTGTASVAHYQAALRSVEFSSSDDNPPGSKTVRFSASDGQATGAPASKTIEITPVADPPTVTTTSSALSYTENDLPTAVDPGVRVSDPDSATLEGATVKIAKNFHSGEDVLHFGFQNGIGGTYDPSTGVLTLSGTATVAHYQAALRTVKYENTSDNPSTDTRTLDFTVTDAPSALDSNTASRDVKVSAVNDPPVVTTTSGSTSWTEGDPAAAIDSSLTVSDADNTALQGATVAITSGFQTGDALHFVNTPNIIGSYDSTTGVLTLSGADTVAHYQDALRSVQFDTTNDNPGTAKTASFTANDGTDNSSAATKDLAITPVNDAPTVTASSGSASFTENGSPVAIDPSIAVSDPDSTDLSGAKIAITSNFTAADGDTLSFTNTANITGSYDSSTGVLTLSGTDTVAHYQAALRAVTFSNTSDNPSTATRTVSFTVTDDGALDSNTGTRDVTVSAVNDPPVVGTTAGNTSYTEGDPATAVDSGITADDPDSANLTGATVTIASGLQTGDSLQFTDQNGITGNYSGGTLTLTGSSSVANYQTALRSVKFVSTNQDPVTSKSVSFQATDGSSPSNTATKTIAVTPVNTPPTVTTSATPLAYTEGDGAVAADSGLTVSDPDSANLSGAKVSITSNFSAADDTLAFTNTANITGSYNSTTGVLTLSGTGTVANYQAALRSVTYSDSSQNPSGSKTLSFQATDNTSVDSNTATRQVNLTGVNDAPVVTTSSGNTAYTEGDPPTTVDGAITASDVDNANLAGGTVAITSGFQTGDVLTFSNQNGITGNYNATTGVLTLTGSSSVANYQTALRSIQFVSTNPAPVTSKTVTFTVNDGSLDSNGATKDIDVTPVNSPPVIGTTDTALQYTENDPATAVDPSLTVSDPEGDPLTGAQASITSNYQSGEDSLSWADNNALDTITESITSTNQTIVLTGAGTAAQYQAALRAVKYADSSDNPSSATRTVTFSATDVGGATGSNIRNVAVTPVDDPPVAVADSATVTEDDPATAVNVLANDTDVDGGPKSIQSVTQPANGTVVITGGGSGLTYQPGPNYCNNPPDTSPDTFTYTLNGGSSATVSMHVICVNDAPVATDDSFTGAVGNTSFVVNDPTDGAPATPDPTDTSPGTDRPHNTISGSILSNDTDVDSPHSALTVTPGTFATHDGGTVTIQSDGDFVFEPAPGTSCTDHSDFFDYTVNDNDPSDPKSSTGQVTIAITGCAWYVNNDDAQGNSGTSAKPFDTLAQAQTAAGAGDSIFVYNGDGTTTGLSSGITLGQNQQLIGEDADFSVGGTALHTGDPTKRPTLTNNNADVVTLASGDTVRGFKIDPQGTGGGISGGSGVASGTLDNLNIVDTGTAGTQAGLELNGTTGTFNVSNLTVDNSGSTGNTSGSEGVLLNNAGLVNFAPAGTISLTTKGAKALDATSTNMGTASTFDDITVTGSGSGAVHMSSTTGTTNLGDGTGTDLDLTTTSGSSPALDLIGPGVVTVPSAGTSNISSTGGPAVNAQGTGLSLALDDVSATNAQGDGIALSSLGTSTFSATGGSLSASGSDVNISGGSGNITYAGTLGDGTGNTANINGRTGGTINLSGNITDTGDVNGGISMSSNTGGSTNFSGATKTINTGTQPAVSLLNNANHTVVFSGGGLGLTTTSGAAFAATGGGNVQVSGTGNTISSGTGRALDIENTNPNANGVTFQSVAANGATNAIKLSNTGSTGSVTVTGTGTSGSGGTIANDTSNAIALDNTKAPSFSRMNITSPQHAGIKGTANVHGFSLTNSTISGAGAAHNDANGDSSVAFDNTTGGTNDNVDGAVTITGNTLSNSYVGGVDVIQYAGTISDANISNNTISSSSDPTVSKGSAIQLNLSGSASTVANLTKAEITNNAITNFPSGQGIVVLGGNQNSSGAPAATIGTPTGNPAGDANVVTISGNSIAGDATNELNGDAILASLSGKGSGSFAITNNGSQAAPITNVGGHVVNIGAAGSGTADFAVTGNVAVAHSILGANGIGLGVNKWTLADSSVLADETVNANIASNNISQTSGSGIRAIDSDGVSGHSLTMNAKVNNNTVGAPIQGNAGIRVDSGGSQGTGDTVCSQISGNTSTGSTDTFGDTHPGIELGERASATFGIVGLSPSPADASQTESYVTGLNPNSSLGGGFYANKRVAVRVGSNFTACTLGF